MISQRSRYALRALLFLAREGGRSFPVAEIARCQSIPRKFLEQILLELKREGIVDSRRGKAGGYVLQRPADTITFGEVLRLLDGPIAPLPCLSRIAYQRCEDCADEGACEIRRVFARVANSARDILDRTTIADAGAGANGRGPLDLLDLSSTSKATEGA
ncbi:Rrf2 family transcriptional regulator [Aureimonas endophytica]|uniref:Rrf2 family transcriptional regulator n=1 Tax=Aureimonas endophytica TaxID=2027858 RepID=A0A916ZJY5_9HYPH|nr:Rrf2 family transcriptional regulator [Aureimonas endophytica]GGE00890.1 Rrf2 family transcriptional regulator [Aureimonas endophytica]